MKPIPALALFFLCHAAAMAATTFTPVAGGEPAVDFDAGWSFARFGLMPDGSRKAEPGVAVSEFRMHASSEETGKGNLAALAMDGDPETRWCASGPDGGQWVKVDFGKTLAVAKADILWEKEPALPCVVEGTTDGAKWSPIPGKFTAVRVRVTGGVSSTRWASIKEIRLTGPDGKPIENKLSPAGPAPMSPDFNDSAWRKLDLPHDWAIEGPFRYDLAGETGKLPWQGLGWYRKKFTVPASDAGKRLFLDFDGAMANAKVYCNGEYAGGRPFGYASFRVDITKFVKPGAENVIAVRLDSEKWGSRWYPGAGIYRHVRLVTTAPVHVTHWGVFVTTPKITAEKAEVKLAVKVENSDTTAGALPKIEADIFEYAADGTVGAKVASCASPLTLAPAGGTAEFMLIASVAKPKLWDINSPHRYLARVRVIEGDGAVATYDQPFGIRTISFTRENGFQLNGRSVKLNGVCQHHDLGALGGAVNERATDRQLEILRTMGCNAIRTSHNPPSPELLDAADRLGFVVMDEAFDVFLQGKKPYDYSSLFAEWRERDLEMLVTRDRNHPSVIMWSMGNEIPEQHIPEKFHLFAENAAIMKKFDTTRPVTCGISAPNATAMSGVELLMDVHGMNYAAGVHGGPDFYGKFLRHPGHEKIVGYSSESASTISSRGEYPPEMGRWQVSSYDKTVGWGSLADAEFAALDKYPEIIGEFVWTGFDYLGEPTPYNSDASNLLNAAGNAEESARIAAEIERIKASRPSSRSSYFGIIDLAGFPKDRFYLYQARWRPELPMAHILPHWNWPGHEGQNIPVQVHTSGDEAELFLNGKSLGRQKKGKYQYRFVWDKVGYTPGELKVVTYKAGKPWATEVMKTAGPAAKLTLAPDRATIKADKKDLSFITLTVRDTDGLMAPRAKDLVKFSVTGPGEIVATDNGDAASFESFQAPSRHAFNGLALVIVRATGPGVITVKAEGEGLATATTTVTAK